MKVTWIVMVGLCWGGVIRAQGPMKPGMPPRPEMMVAHLMHLADADGDHQTSLEEWQSLLDQLSAEGEITAQGVHQYLEAHRPENPHSTETQRRPEGIQRLAKGRPPEPPKMSRSVLEQQFEQWDSDQDGLVDHESLPRPQRGPKPQQR